MNKQQIKAEQDRLRPILFEGADDCYNWATMSEDGEWTLHMHRPTNYPHLGWGFILGRYVESPSQPQTTLDWRDTLIEREVKREKL